MSILSSFFGLRPRTDKEIAERTLEEAKRQYLEMENAVEFYEMQRNMYLARIARLDQYLRDIQGDHRGV